MGEGCAVVCAVCNTIGMCGDPEIILDIYFAHYLFLQIFFSPLYFEQRIYISFSNITTFNDEKYKILAWIILADTTEE